jgi:antitoxin component of MazEF toxin-antitoxin module
LDSAKTKVSQYGDSKVIRIPQLLFSDSAFPFKIDEEVIIQISEGKLIIEATKK